MNKLAYTLLNLIICSIFLTTCSSEFDKAEAQGTYLFANNSLELWKAPRDKNCWIMKNNILHVKSNKKKQGDVLQTKKHYVNYSLSCAFKMGEGTVDSGIHLRDTHDQIQIGISGSKGRDMTCSPYIPGKGYPVEATGVKELLKPKDWNTLKINVINNEYKVWLNGTFVMAYTSSTARNKGPIGIQLHSGKKMEIFFKDMVVYEMNEPQKIK